MTEVTFKVLPAPEQASTLVFFGLADEIAVELMCAAMGSPWEVSGAVHLQAEMTQRLQHSGLRAYGKSITALRLESFGRFIPYRRGRLMELLAIYGDPSELDHEGSFHFWEELRQLSVLQASREPLWRISTSPKAGPRIAAQIRGYMDSRVFYDWSGGLLWVEVLDTADAGSADIRRVMATHGGHATLVRAAPQVRAAIDVFQPEDPGLQRIARGIKASFDPAGILNPGRMHHDM